MSEQIQKTEAKIAAQGAPVVETEEVESPEVKADLDATEAPAVTEEPTPRRRKTAAERLHDVLEERKQDKIDRENERKAAQAKADEVEYWRQIALKRDEAKPQVQPQGDHEKTLEDFQWDQGQYNAYLVDKAVEAKLSAKAKADAEAKESETRTTKMQKFEERVSKYVEENPEVDFSKIMGAPMDRVPINPVMAEFIIESDFGPELSVYIRDNPKEGRAICAMNSRDADRAMAKLEAKLSKEPESIPEQPVQITRAPPAPPRLNANASAAKPSGVAAEIAALRAKKR